PRPSRDRLPLLLSAIGGQPTLLSPVQASTNSNRGGKLPHGQSGQFTQVVFTVVPGHEHGVVFDPVGQTSSQGGWMPA
ncbi:MAG TPA: hypothetical protein VK899_07655, partial [Gemmatimonadales bacterium]|nr:hypothetical protein [Gemmatimonadales bacterium]